MKIEIIKGTEYEVGSDAHRKAVSDRQGEESRREGELAALRQDCERLRSELEARPDIGAAVRARVALTKEAERAGVELREDMEDSEIRRAIVEAVFPGLLGEDQEEAFIAGAYTAAISRLPVTSPDKVREDAVRFRRESGNNAPAVPPDEAARRAMIRKSNGIPS